MPPLRAARDLAEDAHDPVLPGGTDRGHGRLDRRPGAGLAEAVPPALPLGLCDGEGDSLGELLDDGHSRPSHGPSVVGSPLGVGSCVGSSLGSSVGSWLLVGEGFLVGDGGAVVGSYPVLGASPSTYTGSGKSSTGTPSIIRCMMASHVWAG